MLSRPEIFRGAEYTVDVTNAFRLRVLSRPVQVDAALAAAFESPMPFGCGCYPDETCVTLVTDATRKSTMPFGGGCYPDLADNVYQIASYRSPMPLGCGCESDVKLLQGQLIPLMESPMPFGCRCEPDESQAVLSHHPEGVTNAFRLRLLSRR